MVNFSGNLPNVLVIVIDALRLDYANQYASTLSKLGEQNLMFEDAIAPAPWSLPSHVSMFSGIYPADHDSHRADDSMRCRTAEKLSEIGYNTVGISGNGFASQRTGFHESYDEFYYTGGRDPYIEGLDVSGTAQNIMRQQGASQVDAMFEILRSIPSQDHPAKSLANLLAVGCGEAAMKIEALQRIPHQWFAPDSGFCYEPKRNTDRVLKVLEREGPQFVFANYMDTHRPYAPDEERQRAHLGRSLSRSELRHLNETVASPRKFLELVAKDRLDGEDVEKVRGLYAGEVETADEQLDRILTHLKQTGLDEETLVVVTSDHGENLGEIDDMGRRRMGHEGSLSDAVLSVPLVIAHPDIDPRSVEGHVSLKNLHHQLVEGVEDLLASGGADLGPMNPPEGPVWSHYPAVGGEQLFEKYPDAPREAIAQRVSVDGVAGYQGDWKIVASSQGVRWARNGSDVVDYGTVPEELRSECEDQLSELSTGNKGDEGLSENDISQLEALGYM